MSAEGEMRKSWRRVVCSASYSFGGPEDCRAMRVHMRQRQRDEQQTVRPWGWSLLMMMRMSIFSSLLQRDGPGELHRAEAEAENSWRGDSAVPGHCCWSFPVDKWEVTQHLRKNHPTCLQTQRFTPMKLQGISPLVVPSLGPFLSWLDPWWVRLQSGQDGKRKIN